MPIKIKALLSTAAEGQKVIVQGWVRTFRANRFIALNDGSTLGNLQCVVDFENFDDFLKIFTSRQRKNIKKEREAIRQLDIKFSTKEGENLELDDWNIFFKFYVNTYYQRMQRPYLNKEFFELIIFFLSTKITL